MSQRIFLLATLAVFSLLAACERKPSVGTEAAQQERTAAQRLAWSSTIASHTSGVVSRNSAVQIVFVNEVASGASVVSSNTPSIEPKILGEWRFVSKRELQFVPQEPWVAGTTYRVRLTAAGLKEISANLPPYEFSFMVQTPQFDVELQELESMPSDDSRMVLRGQLTTADSEDAAKVAALLTVSHRDTAQKISWLHDADSRVHRFSVADLVRGDADAEVTARWNGASIGSKNQGEASLTVPRRNAFVITDAQALDTTDRRMIVVTFSDALSLQQNLSGLVKLGDYEFTSRVEGNQLTLYPNAEIEGSVTLTITRAIRNLRGVQLGDDETRELTFTSTKPQVRWVGRGVILPDGDKLTVPFEAVSARSVRVTAVRIYEENIAQFLQVNRLDGNNEIGRVGRFLWRKVLPLTGPRNQRWQRYEVDVTELTRKHPGALFQLTLQLTPEDAAWDCGDDTAATTKPDPEPRSQEDGDTAQSSSWDYFSELYEDGGEWSQRRNPCNIAYYRYGDGISAERNLLASNIGLLAKRDQYGRMLVAATDLRSATPLSGAKLSLRNFQNQVLASGSTDGNGLANLSSDATPFLLLAEANGQRGYLKLAAGGALPVSHFDVGGESVQRGLKGHIYGDRGVWRPGDAMHLTFVLQDKGRSLPPNHPVTLELYDPRGRLAQSLVNAQPVGGFYAFTLRTAVDAPTGDWLAKAQLGSSEFSRRVKVETVIPNRLRIALDLGSARLTASEPVRGTLAAEWLSGATAAGLKADTKVRLTPTRTAFTSFKDYVFDDPAREFASEPIDVYEGELDGQGRATLEQTLRLDRPPPGMLTATFTTRVFERGGAFSIQRETAEFAPYKNFVGVRLPKGDAARDMLLTDTDHVAEIAALDSGGKPVAKGNIQLSLYKVEWKWWWDRSGDSLAQFVERQNNALVSQGRVAIANGRGNWKFRISYPEWGRYLLRACDADGGHCTGQVFYIDWPAWAGKEREQSGPAANVLTITADKAEYRVGETATLQLPETAEGRALVTVENGTGILESRWLEPRAGNTRFTLPLTAAMTPNVYVAVTLVQPHRERKSERPLRLYGVIPLAVTDPATRLEPQLKVATEWRPASKGRIDVSESQGRAMHYTLAVVDEGLLSLTNFKTPRLHDEFYKREALGVATWDLFDQVAGAYSAQLERLLALGGSDSGPSVRADDSKTRFPPVVRFLGPFTLKAGAKASHEVELPQYFGAVRVMLVAGEAGAYGSADKSVFVRQPLMLLPTLPRVAGPGEEITVPVSLFVTDKSIRDVTLSIEPDSYFSLVGEAQVRVAFTQPEEKLGLLRLRTANKLGQGRVRFVAQSGPHRATGEIYLDIRSSNPPVSRYVTQVLQPGERWSTVLKPLGLAGTNSAMLEVSALPPLNLESRLAYLVQYPHGCLEQTTSGAFPQLYLPKLLNLNEGRRRQIEEHVRAAIERLRSFQLAQGNFSFWPGGTMVDDDPSLSSDDLWASIYASHFLLEAEKSGYNLPGNLRSGTVRALRRSANNWSAPRWRTERDAGARAIARGAALVQAYRLYVLAQSGAAELGAMNRLRELRNLPALERWLLAAAYQKAGLRDVARELTSNLALDIGKDRDGSLTYGSTLRDQALLLVSLIALGRFDLSADLVRAISSELTSEGWHSTQSVAYSLMVMAKFAGSTASPGFTIEQRVGSAARSSVSSNTTLWQQMLAEPAASGTGIELRNTSQRVLFATVSTRGVPAAGRDEAASSGLTLDVVYLDAAGQPASVSRLKQGTDITAVVTVRNQSPGRLENLALTQMVPAGWEIHNQRLDNAAPASNARVQYTDIRDDRVLHYFALGSGEQLELRTQLNASYRGRFYLPSVSVEAMYDARKYARSRGQWVEVVAGH